MTSLNNPIVNRTRNTSSTMGQFYSSQGTNNVDETKSPKWVPVLDQPVHTPRKIRVVCVGAGVSGLILAHKYKYELKMDEYIDFTIYEKNQDVGGTWFENRYPGVACDVRLQLRSTESKR